MKKYLLLLLIPLLLSGCSIGGDSDFVLQEKCTKHAHDFLEYYINNPEERKRSIFTNHFNSKLNKCFVLIEKNKGGGIFSNELFEAVEKKSYGTTIGKLTGDGGSPDLINCTIYNWKKESIEKCESGEEFHKQVSQLLELNNL